MTTHYYIPLKLPNDGVLRSHTERATLMYLIELKPVVKARPEYMCRSQYNISGLRGPTCRPIVPVLIDPKYILEPPLLHNICTHHLPAYAVQRRLFCTF